MECPDKPEDLFIYGNTILAAGKDNKWLPNPSPAYTALPGALAVLEAAIIKGKTGLRGAVAERKSAEAAVVKLIQQNGAAVQIVANENPAHAVEIITSAGYKVLQTGGRHSQTLHCEKGDVAGEAYLYVPVFADGAVYFARYTVDGKTFVDVMESHKTKIHLTNLPLHQTISIQYRASCPSKRMDWSEPISYFVV
jgi:hypothetical protein